MKVQYKLLAALWALLAFSVVGFGVIGADFLRFQLEGEVHGDSVAMSRAFLIVAADAMRAGRPKDAFDFIEALRAFPDVEEARLLDSSGVPVFSKRSGPVATFRADPESLALALKSFTPVIKTEFRGGRRYKVVYQRVWSERPSIRTLGVCYLRLSYARVEGSMRRVLKVFLPILLAWAIILHVLAAILARRITRPLEKVRAAAVEVGRGRLDLKVPVTTGDELGELASAFNQMVDTLSRTTISKDYFTAVVDASPVPIIAVDLSGNVTFWNPAAEKAFGWTAAEILGRRLPIIPDDEIERFEQLLVDLVAGMGHSSVELIRKRRDGSAALFSISRAGLRGSDGRVTGAVALFSDLTERKRLESRFLQIEKLSAVGRLAAGVAHELNNPLGVILAFTQTLRRAHGPDDPRSFPLESIEREALRCRDLVANLLTYSRAAKPEDRGPVDLNETLSEALALIDTPARRQSTAVNRELAPEIPTLHANRNQLQQVVFNLCYNALDAVERGGALTVRTAPVSRDGHDGALLEVRDDGPGMSEELQKSIFEPFFTTKEPGKGTGLGLSLVHEIVQRHGGTIEVTSRPGEGAAFAVWLPKAPLD